MDLIEKYNKKKPLIKIEKEFKKFDIENYENEHRSIFGGYWSNNPEVSNIILYSSRTEGPIAHIKSMSLQ